MDRAYTEDDEYGEVASSIDKDIEKAIRPVLNKWKEEGYSIRDISHIAMGAIFDWELWSVLESRMPKKGKEEL